MNTTWTQSETERRALVETGTPVVCNLHKGDDENLRAWAAEQGRFVACERKSKSFWCNPFEQDKKRKDADRDEVCDKFRQVLRSSPDMIQRLPELVGKVLGCWCHPKRCHCDEIVSLMRERGLIPAKPYEAIPAELKGLPRWVLWKLVPKDGRMTKIPFQENGCPASSTNPGHWLSFDAAQTALASGRFTGLGFVFNGDGIAGIDLDKHRNPDTGDLDEFARAIVDDLGSYTEVSPSGTGLHIITRATIPGESGRRDAKQGLEAYSSGRFFCMTGQHVPGTPATVEHRQAEVARFYATHFTPKAAQPTLTVPEPAPVALAGDDDLLRRAAGASNGAKFSALWRGDWVGSYGSQSEADAALLGLLYFWCGGDRGRAFSLFARSGLHREKWAAREDYRNDTWAMVAHGPTYDHQHRSPSPVPAPGNPGLPIIELPGNGVTYTDCARQLFGLIGPTKTLFNRGGAVMRLATDDRGQPQLVGFDPNEAKSCFEKHGRLMAHRKGEGGEMILKPVLLSNEIATGLLSSEERRELLPTIKGLIGCPVLREIDGALHVAGKGYDSRSGYLITGGALPPDVGLPEAVARLGALLDDFDFQTPGDRARAFAGLITPGLKMGGFIRASVPCELAEANSSQSGKTFRLIVNAAVYAEEPSYVTQTIRGVGSTDETFSTALVRGRPFILLDNWRGQLNSPHMESFLTASGNFPCRIPRVGTIEVQPEGFFVGLSSNGVEVTEDFANRSSLVRIRKHAPGFEFRSFPEGNLLQHVQTNQAFYLGCVHAVISEWHRRGKPTTSEATHSFREWSRTMDYISQHILDAGPLMDGHKQLLEQRSTPELVWARALLLEIEKEGRLGEGLTCSNIFELCGEVGMTIPGLDPRGDDQKAAIRIGRIMGKVFGDEQTITIDGMRFSKGHRMVKRTDGGDKILKVYTVERV